MIWATISSRSCFCWLNRASPSSAAKNIISLISVLTIWWCPCVELSLWYHSPSLCPTTNAEDAEVEQFYEDLQDILELTPKKDVLFFIVTQSCSTLCDTMDCSPPGSSVHGYSPGKNTGMGCHALLQGIFPTQGSNPGLQPTLEADSLLSEPPGKPWGSIKDTRWSHCFGHFTQIQRHPGLPWWLRW